MFPAAPVTATCWAFFMAQRFYGKGPAAHPLFGRGAAQPEAGQGTAGAKPANAQRVERIEVTS